MTTQPQTTDPTGTEDAFPSTLYIYVYPDELEDALANGLDTSETEPALLANADYYAAGLAKMIGGIRINDFVNVEVAGKVIAMPQYDRFTEVYVLSILVETLDTNNLYDASSDFDSDFYPKPMRCFYYRARLEPASISAKARFKLNSPDVPMAP